ncbi:MAG: TonB family protein [Alphaproteobacteria bacterium]|nr:TonB family protein [Alphaproteobacteria bacterium]
MRLRARHGVIALGIAGAIHLGIAALMLDREAERGAQNAGLGGLTVSLATGGAPGQPTETVETGEAAETVSGTTEAETVEAPETEAIEETETAEAVVLPMPVPIKPESVEAEPVEAEVVEAEPVEAEVVEPDVVEPEAIHAEVEPAPVDPESIQTVVAPTPEPVAPKGVETVSESPQVVVPVRRPPRLRQTPRPVEPSPLPTRKPTPAPVIEQAATPAATTAATQAATQADPAPAPRGHRAALPPVSGTGGSAGPTEQPSRNESQAGGGTPGATADYLTTLRLWLEKHKEYPRRAMQRRQEGTAILAFVVGADGAVISRELNRSSGFSLLDREVMAMIERAQPLPPPPKGLGQNQLAVKVPVTFILGQRR